MSACPLISGVLMTYPGRGGATRGVERRPPCGSGPSRDPPAEIWVGGGRIGYWPKMERGTRYAEREVKMSAGLEFELPDLRKLGLGTVHLPLQRLRTSYFDTADLRLWQRGITLRHRVGEDDSGTWTLKLSLIHI